MKESKNNWKVILKILEGILLLLLVLVFLLKKEYRNVVIILMIALVVSLMLQLFIYVVKPGLFDDKNKRLPG